MIQQGEQKMNKIAIIGSGITGISVAYRHPSGSSITIFDKSRRPGGRISTRTSRQYLQYCFDHGATFLEPKEPFQSFLKQIDAVKEVNVKNARFSLSGQMDKSSKRMLMGNPQIQTIPLKLVSQLKKTHQITQKYNCRIQSIELNKDSDKILLMSQEKEHFGPFDQAYFCLPFPQCRALQQDIVKLPQFPEPNYYCTWVINASFEPNSEISLHLKDLDVVTHVDESIESMTSQRTRSKTSDDLWVIRMSNLWSQAHINLKPEEVEKEFLNILAKNFQSKIQPKYLQAHRWLYSLPVNTPNEPIVGKNIIFGGDWVGQRKDVHQCWELGKILYKRMNGQGSI